MATLPEKVAAPADPMAGIASLLSTLGGTKTTTNAGNTDVLNSAVGSLKGQDYEGLLQSIFQRAGAEIPGIQRAFGNAVGARSGGNSAVSAALQKLMQQTTVGAQSQIANQQQANLNAQIQAGANIAQATKGTTQQQGTNVGQAAKIMTLLSVLNKTGLDKKLSGLFGDTPGTPSSPLTSAYAPVASPWADAGTGGGPVTSAPFNSSLYSAQSPDPTQFVDFGTGLAAPSAAPTLSAEDAANFDALSSGWDSSPVDMSGFFTPSAPISYTPSFELPSNYMPVEDFNFDFSIPDFNFADGGRVSAGGSRRSANPTVAPIVPTGMAASNAPASVAIAPSRPVVPSAPLMPTMIDPRRRDFMRADEGQYGAGEGGAQGDASLGTAATAATAGQVAGAIMGVLGAPAAMSLGTTAATSQNPTAAIANGILGTIAGPAIAIGNLGLSALGFNSIGQTISGLLSPSVDLSLAQSMDPANNAVAASGVVGSPVSGPGAVDVTDLGMLGVDIGGEADGWGGVGDSGPGGSSGDVGASAGGADASGPGGYQNGGPIKGKGTGTSDSININASDGEYIIPDDVVEIVGESFFDRLLAAFHTPVGSK